MSLGFEGRRTDHATTSLSKTQTTLPYLLAKRQRRPDVTHLRTVTQHFCYLQPGKHFSLQKLPKQTQLSAQRAQEALPYKKIDNSQ